VSNIPLYKLFFRSEQNFLNDEMTSVVILWYFCFYIATFQQNPYTKIYLSFDEIFMSLWILSLFFFQRGLLLTMKLLNQWFLKSSLRLLYGRHHDFVNCYGIYVSQITTHIFCLPSTQSFPYSYLVIEFSLNNAMVKSYERALLSCLEHIRYIQSVLVQDFVSGRGCCVEPV
jgi:hypothetical protein